MAGEVLGVGELGGDGGVGDDYHGREDGVPVEVEDCGEFVALLDGVDDGVGVCAIGEGFFDLAEEGEVAEPP